MGVDVNAYVTGALADDALDEANRFLALRGIHGWDHSDPALVRDEYEPERVEWRTLYRYYGPGYERGPWPNIYGALVGIRAALPAGVTVHYGSDSFDDAPPVTDEVLSDLWAHWLGPDGAAYRDR